MDAAPPITQTRAFGPQLGEYGPRPELLRWNRLLAGVGLLGGGVALGIGLWRWSFGYSNYGPVVVWRWSAAWLLVGAPLLIAGMAGLIWIIRWRWVTVGAYSGGLRFVRGSREVSLPWADIVQIYASGVRYGIFRWAWGSRAEVNVVANRERRIRLNQTIGDLDQLLETIKRHVYPRLLADYSRRFRGGQTLTFGPLVLKSEGVSKGRREIKWEDLTSVRMEGGKILFNPRPGRGVRTLRANAHAVPNVDICLQLIRHLIRAGQPSSRSTMSRPASEGTQTGMR